jgi:hypothetical protein
MARVRDRGQILPDGNILLESFVLLSGKNNGFSKTNPGACVGPVQGSGLVWFGVLFGVPRFIVPGTLTGPRPLTQVLNR